MDLPYEKAFKELPDSNAEDFVLYFNLEYGLEFGAPEEDKYKIDDFMFLGLYLNSEGIETMYWSVKDSENNYAVKQPYDGKYITSMTNEKPLEKNLIQKNV